MFQECNNNTGVGDMCNKFELTQPGCEWVEAFDSEVCCCYGDKYVKILMNPSHNNTFSLLFRCNGGNNSGKQNNGGNLQYGSVLVTLIMAVISKFI